jgi:hypothetical protein
MSFNTIIKISLLSACLLIALLFSCRKEQPEMNAAADPCACASEVSADFDILERHSQVANSEIIVTDHVLQNSFTKQVRFRAKEEDAEYTWYIGIDVETDQETYKNFGTEWIGSTIPITLVVKKEANTVCFPDDDGYDSITKTFNIYDECHEPYLLEGTFRMASENSTDSIDIDIEFIEYPPQNDCFSADITNFDGEGSTCPGNYFRVSKSYRYMQAVGGTNVGPCQSLSPFKAWVYLDGTCEMKYEYFKDSDTEQEMIKHLFGRKLN